MANRLHIRIVTPSAPQVQTGNVVDGVSWDLIVRCLTGYAHGQYSVDYLRC